MANKHTATWEDATRWILAGVFRIEVEDGKATVWKTGAGTHGGDRELTQRENLRKRCNHGDARVDLQHEGIRRSCHVSGLVWVSVTKQVIPPDFEIHHLDEDPNNNRFDNLVCVHKYDHPKLHETYLGATVAIRDRG